MYLKLYKISTKYQLIPLHYSLLNISKCNESIYIRKEELLLTMINEKLRFEIENTNSAHFLL